MAQGEVETDDTVDKCGSTLILGVVKELLPLGRDQELLPHRQHAAARHLAAGKAKWLGKSEGAFKEKRSKPPHGR